MPVTVAEAHEYGLAVLEGKIEVCQWTRLAVERHFRDLEEGYKRGLSFSVEAAQHVLDFFSFLKHSKGEWAGQYFELAPWQAFWLCVQFGWLREDGFRRFRTAYWEVPRKNGKGFTLDTLLPTPHGWTTMDAVRVGDVLFDDQGLPCRITAIGDVRYLDCYKIIFSNGEEVICDGDHLWLTTARVNDPGGKGTERARYRSPSLRLRTTGGGVKRYWYACLYRYEKFLGREDDPKVYERFESLAAEDLLRFPLGNYLTRVRSTRELLKTLRYGKRGDLNHSIAMPCPLELPDVKLPIDPYLLGVWLGDGHSGGSVISCGQEDVDFIARQIEALGYTVARCSDRTCWRLNISANWDRRRALKTALRTLGLIQNKHIPPIYLRASKAQRLALLQGLMDTDGHVSCSGRILEYCTVKHGLAEGVRELLASLGVKFSVREKPLRCNGKAVAGRSFNVQFQRFADELPVFRLTRKLERMRKRADCFLNPRSRTVQIVDIQPVETVPTKCIQVDSPSQLYRFGRTMLPTHNTTLLAGGGLYLFVADAEPGAEVYSAATKRDQAKISHGEATRMVRGSPALRSRIGVYKDNLHHLPSSSKFEPLGADADTSDGLNIHAALIDELHAHKTRDLWDVLETAAGSRRQPMQWAITTAGFDAHGICFEQRTYLTKILERIFEDDAYFGVIYGLDKEDVEENRWHTERAFRKANPNYGISVKPDDMHRLAQKALEMPAAQNNFLCKRLDVWTRQETLWMNMERWAACAGEVDLEALRGRECFAGLDLSSTKDLTALVLLFPTDSGLKVYGRYYLPEEAIAERARVDRVPYDIWHREGRFQVTPGNIIDYGFIRRDINALQERFVIREIAYDRWGATGLATDLMADGFTVVPIGQGFASLSSPTKEIERLILSKGIAHGGDPVLTWMMSNVAVMTDPAENIKPAKNKSTERIDGIVALIMALARQMVLPPTAGSVYEDRGIVTL